MLALHIIALVAAVKLLVETENVVLCASLYTGLCMICCNEATVVR